MGKSWVWVLGVASWLLACDSRRDAQSRWADPATVVLIHTADLHSHVFPEPTLISPNDARRGLGPSGSVVAVGGLARIATLVAGLRAEAAHVLYLDSGDVIEGTDVFTAFGGEPELRALSALRVDASALGNHDLDPGTSAFVDFHRRFARFPVLAANYAAPSSGLGSLLLPYVTLNAGGVRVGVIGVANESSPGGLASPNNPYEISLSPVAEAVQGAIDTLRPSVDVLVAISHLGLDADEAMIRATSGLDVVLGGHQHLTIDSALERFDCGEARRAERGCHERRVFLVHSGAFGRYVGRIELSLAPAARGDAGDEPEGLEVVSATHSLLPVSNQVEDDAVLAALLQPYRERLASAGFDTPVAFALGPVPRYAEDGGDSALGDLIADALRARASSDLALLNTTGIRADLPPGVLSKAAFVSALPLGDTLTVLQLSGSELTALFDKQAALAGPRGCQAQFQGAGFEVSIACSGGVSHLALLRVGGVPVSAAGSYSLVTTDYLADNGAGFPSAAHLSKRVALEADALDVVLSAVSQRPVCGKPALPCLDPRLLRDGRISLRAP